MVDDWPEGFAYEARTVNEYKLQDGDIDDVSQLLMDKFIPYYNDQDSLLSPISKALGLHDVFFASSGIDMFSTL